MIWIALIFCQTLGVWKKCHENLKIETTKFDIFQDLLYWQLSWNTEFLCTVRWAWIKQTSKKHEKYYHSIKVGTLEGQNPLCLKSYKIRTPMKIFKKPIFKVKWRGFSGIRTHEPRIARAVLYHCSILHKGIRVQKILVMSWIWGLWVQIPLTPHHFTLKIGFLKIFIGILIL